MKLNELSAAYRAGEERIAGRMRALRVALRQTKDPEERAALERRLRELRPLRQESRELAELTARYYEKGYCRHEKYTL